MKQNPSSDKDSTSHRQLVDGQFGRVRARLQALDHHLHRARISPDLSYTPLDYVRTITQLNGFDSFVDCKEMGKEARALIARVHGARNELLGVLDTFGHRIGRLEGDIRAAQNRWRNTSGSQQKEP